MFLYVPFCCHDDHDMLRSVAGRRCAYGRAPESELSASDMAEGRIVLPPQDQLLKQSGGWVPHPGELLAFLFQVPSAKAVL